MNIKITELIEYLDTLTGKEELLIEIKGRLLELEKRIGKDREEKKRWKKFCQRGII